MNYEKIISSFSYLFWLQLHANSTYIAKNYKLLLYALLISSITIAQIKYSDLLNTVKALKVNHIDYATDSPWIQKVTFHKYYDSQSRRKVFFAIAKMNGREYVFCDFPFSNQLSYVGKWNLSSGKAFHKYIFNYKCNCE